jgi:hypothetical protein
MADAVETNNNNQLDLCGAYIAVLLAVSESTLYTQTICLTQHGRPIPMARIGPLNA